MGRFAPLQPVFTHIPPQGQSIIMGFPTGDGPGERNNILFNISLLI